MAPSGGSWKVVTYSIQCLMLLLIVAHSVHVLDLDEPVASCWRWLYQSRFPHTPMAEAVVAAVSFFAWIVVFRSLDSMTCFQQFRLIPRPAVKGLPVPIQDFSDAVSSLGSSSLKASHWRVFRIFASFPVYILAIWFLHLFRTPRPLQEAAPTFWRLIGELAFGLFAYDFLFYWLHLGMHRWPSAWHGHHVHHGFRGDTSNDGKLSDRFLEADSVLLHSLFDGGLQVLTNIIVQNLTPFGVPKHKLCRFLHNMLATYLLAEIHSGLDLPWSSHRLFPKVMGGAPRHEYHHHTHKHCYHQFFMYLDDLFGYGPPRASFQGSPPFWHCQEGTKSS